MDKTEADDSMRPPKWFSRLALAVAIATLAYVLRNWYANVVPGLSDEYSYLAQVEQIKEAISGGNLGALTRPIGTNDHPHLVKVLFALRVMTSAAPTALLAARSVSVAFGTLAVFVLALYSPVAGLLLAIQSSAIKYTGVAMLEALPQAMVITSILALQRSRTDTIDRYLVLSAAALGIMAAAKFTYVPLALVVFYLLHFSGLRRSARPIVAYYAIAFSTFVLLVPPLWVDPVGYLRDMMVYHAEFGRGLSALNNRFPSYQPFVWMMRPTPDYQELFPFSFDLPILAFGIVGLWRLQRQEKWVTLWLVAGLAALLLWPNKWPQYPMLIYPALAISAARFFERWSPRQSLTVAVVILALTLRWSTVLVLPVADRSFEGRTVSAAVEVAQSVRSGSWGDLPAHFADSPATAASILPYSSLFLLRDIARPGEIDFQNYVYLGRLLNSLFGAGTVALVALENIPAAVILAVHSAVLGESIRADSGSIGQFFVVLGLLLSMRLSSRVKGPALGCLALGIAILPGYLLVVLPLLVLFPLHILRGRHDYALFVGALAILLMDVWSQPLPQFRLLLASSNLPSDWWQSTLMRQSVSLFSEFGSLPLILDVLISLSAILGIFFVRRRLAVLIGTVSLTTLFVPLGYRPWFLICGPLLAYSAGRFYTIVADSLSAAYRQRALSRDHFTGPRREA